MKKYWWLFLCTLLTLALVIGCDTKGEENDKEGKDAGVSFMATVLENNGSSLLVEPQLGSRELSSADKVVVYVGDKTALKKGENQKIAMTDIAVGQLVEIAYNGAIAESYPAQIHTSYHIKLMEHPVFLAEDENFRVRTYINQLILEENREITLYSTIEYIGSKDAITIWSGEPYFNYTIFDGQEYFSQGVTLSVLKATQLKKGEVYTLPFAKSGGFSQDDPKAEFWQQFYAEKELRLPKGDYTFRAYTDFALDEDLKEKVDLAVEFQVKVN